MKDKLPSDTILIKIRCFSAFIAIILCFGLVTPAFAANTDFVIKNGVLTKYNGPGGDVVIPSNVVEIGEYAFNGCGGITSIVIPESVVSIGSYAFRGCSSLKSITFPNSEPLREALKDVDLHKLFWGDGALEEIVNCPVDELSQRITDNEAFFDKWINLGSYVSEQSERVTALSNQICAGLTSDAEKVHAVYDWMIENIKYDYEHYYGNKKSVTTSVNDVLDSKLTICAGYSRLTQALLQAQGIPTMILRGQVNNGSGWAGHDWNAAFTDGQWIVLDTTWGRPRYMDDKNFQPPRSGAGFDQSWFDPQNAYLSLSHHTTSVPTSSAKNIPSDWAQTEIREAIFTGLAPYNLQSVYQNEISREEFCQLMIALIEQRTDQPIANYLAAKGLTINNPFSDTNSSEVVAAHALGIVNGTSATTFNPNGVLSRQEAATMLYRAGKLLGMAAAQGEHFSDAGQFASWAEEGIAFVSGTIDPITGNKVMGGTGGGNFSPDGKYTREQAIVTALRLLHGIGNQ